MHNSDQITIPLARLTLCVPRAPGLGVCDESDTGDMSHQRGNSGEVVTNSKLTKMIQG